MLSSMSFSAARLASGVSQNARYVMNPDIGQIIAQQRHPRHSQPKLNARASGLLLFDLDAGFNRIFSISKLRTESDQPFWLGELGRTLVGLLLTRQC